VSDPGAATYVLPVATGDGYTLLGSPTVIADLVVTGAEYAQVAGRLWDVGPDGMQTLVSHGFYRPRSDNLGPQVFQLPPNGWYFAAGHAVKLELLGQSVPAGHASAGPFTVTLRTLELRLPVRQTADGAVVRAPASHVFPPSDPEPPHCPPAPSAACHGAAKSALAISQGKRDAKDRIAWSWKGDDSVDPAVVTGATGASLCLWDGAGDLVLSAPAPVAGMCGKRACWSANAARARYKDKRGTRTGVRALSIGAKKNGSGAGMAGAGDRLALPSLPIPSLPVVVQLHTGSGTCFDARYTEATQNERRLEAKTTP
jgi:hypothetical protein